MRNLTGFRICLAKDTVHSLPSCYGLLTALVLFNSVAIWCNTDRAGLKGRGARDDFHWRVPMTYFMMSSFV